MKNVYIMEYLNLINDKFLEFINILHAIHTSTNPISFNIAT